MLQLLANKNTLKYCKTGAKKGRFTTIPIRKAANNVTPVLYSEMRTTDCTYSRYRRGSSQDRDPASFLTPLQEK